MNFDQKRNCPVSNARCGGTGAAKIDTQNLMIAQLSITDQTISPGYFFPENNWVSFSHCLYLHRLIITRFHIWVFPLCCIVVLINEKLEALYYASLAVKALGIVHKSNGYACHCSLGVTPKWGSNKVNTLRGSPQSLSYSVSMAGILYSFNYNGPFVDSTAFFAR